MDAPTTLGSEETQFIVDQSERDAERVNLFLRSLGFEQIWRFPVIFLMELAAALRLIYWEMKGFSFQNGAGLPTGSEALYKVLRVFLAWTEDGESTEDEKPTDYNEPLVLMPSVLKLSLQHLSWSGRSSVGADLAVSCDEEKLIDLMAKFCVKYRHSVIKEPSQLQDKHQEVKHGKKT